MSVVEELRAALGVDLASKDLLKRYAYASDASHYLRVPEAVVVAESIRDIVEITSIALRNSVPMTFRSGGTSLSGQSSGNGILVDTRRAFKQIELLDGGGRVRVQAGATLRAVNARLAPHGRILGPDPASDIACTIGGVIANNSSGMAAGTELNSYRTLESLVAVLPSGTVIDSSAPGASDALRLHEPSLVGTLERLRDRIRSDVSQSSEVRERFSMKNTMGYGLNSFLDFDDPLDILVHLLIGSEGTLAFVAEAVFRTIPLDPEVATGLLVFGSMEDATAALPTLVKTGAATLELMDSTLD